MRNIRTTILVFGATGRQGGAVARELRRDGWAVRVFVRDPAAREVSALRDIGVDIVSGTLGQADAIRAAMRGVHGVFSVLPGNLSATDEVRFGCEVADLAADSGVAHFVYSSGGSAGEALTGVPRFDAKPRIEAHVRKLPITATIIRPMIFMDMLIRPGNGLNEGRLTSLVRPDQSMQLIAVEDIGRFVAAILKDPARFGNRTLKLASDTVTGNELASILSDVAARPITYARFPDAVLTANSDLDAMARSLEDGPLADHADLDALRAINPHLVSFRTWVREGGRAALAFALASPTLDDEYQQMG